MDKESKILIVGHGGIIENSLTAHLQNNGFARVSSSSKTSLNVFDQQEVQKFFTEQKPEYVFLASTRSGGIEANQKYAAEFIHSNLMSQNNIIHAAYENGVRKLLFLSSSCIYPKESPQPIKEEYLLGGPLEPTSEPYAMAKIAGIKMCQAYRQQYRFNAIVMIPATIYGPGSDVDIRTSHVLGALLGKFYDAVKNNEAEVVVWGTGKPRREFLFVEDFIEAALFLMEKYDDSGIINAGYGSDVSIKELAGLIAKQLGFKGKVVFNDAMSDGAMQKLLDNTRISNLGWKAKVKLEEGIEKTYQWYEQLNQNGVMK